MIKIKFLEKLLSLIYSRKCFYCSSVKEDKFLCSKCYRKVHFLPPSVLKEISGSKVYACTLYDDVIKQLVKDFKYKRKKYLAEVQAQIMFEFYKQLNLKKDFLVLPVPVHKNRKRERGYNHMDLTAREFSYLSKLKCNNEFLIRVKDTNKQFKLHKTERIKNIKDAFGINFYKAPDKNTPLLIIDDITAAGITLEEIIKLLKKNGYKNISALVLSTPDIWN